MRGSNLREINWHCCKSLASAKPCKEPRHNVLASVRHSNIPRYGEHSHHCLISCTSLKCPSYDTNHSTDLKPADAAEPGTGDASKQTAEEPTSKEDTLDGSDEIIGVFVTRRGWNRIKVQTRIEARLTNGCDDDSQSVAA